MAHIASARRAILASALLVLIVPAMAIPAFAQGLYRYRDENGAWVYTDRVPDSQPAYETLDSQPPAEVPTVELTERPDASGKTLVISNTYYAPVLVTYRLSRVRNLARDIPREGSLVVDARSELAVFAVEPEDRTKAMQYRIQFEYMPGSPDARHAPDTDYRVPYALANTHAVSQAFPTTVTHADAGSRYAVDFELPVGTDIVAARGGIVIDIAGEFFEAGQDPDDASRANFVRVLHDDGTLAVYAHLNRSSIRVRPGQRIERGEYIADSGNTGFSSGPHLHFAVQRNENGVMTSLPVRFTGRGGASVELKTGDLVTAY